MDNSLSIATSYSSVKETNWLINKGMCVLLFGFGVFKQIWEKLKFSKLVGKVNFSERKFEEMH